MKCTECPKYSECVMTSDLRRKRRNCTYARDKKPITNYEHIKNMSVEEMADLLAKRNLSCMPFCKECENCNQNTFKYPLCVKGIEKWLESEVKE